LSKSLKPEDAHAEVEWVRRNHRGEEPTDNSRFWSPSTVALLVGTGLCCGLAVATLSLHLGFRPVLTGSMRPTYGPGALLVTRQVPVQSVHPGMIVLFTPPGEHAEFAHRIATVSGPAAQPVITTKGDANLAPDPWHARLTSASIAEVVAEVPWVGRLMVGMHGTLQIALIVLGGLLAAVAGSRWILAPQGRAVAA
jgi:signal peptidase I